LWVGGFRSATYRFFIATALLLLVSSRVKHTPDKTFIMHQISDKTVQLVRNQAEASLKHSQLVEALNGTHRRRYTTKQY